MYRQINIPKKLPLAFQASIWCILLKDARVKDMENIQDTHPIGLLGLILQYQWGLTEVDFKDDILQSQGKSRYFKKISSFLFPEMCQLKVTKLLKKKKENS